MRRTSDDADELRKLCRRLDYEITERRLETLSGPDVQLMPPEQWSALRKVEFFKEVDKLTGGHGRTFERAALALAARGFPSDGYRSVMLKQIGEPTILPPIDPESDGDFQEVEETATALLSNPSFQGFPGKVGKVLNDALGRRLDVAASELGLPVDVIAHSVATNLVHATVVEDPDAIYDADLVLAMSGAIGVEQSGPRIDVMRDSMAWLARYGPVWIKTFLSTASLEELIAPAVMVRSNFEMFDLSSDIGIEQQDVICGLIGPFFYANAYAMLRAIAQRIPGFEACAELKMMFQAPTPTSVPGTSGEVGS